MASIPDALKAILDLLPERALDGKVALPLATGGSLAHMLAVDYALKPVLSFLKTEEIVHSVFADDSQIHYDDARPLFSAELEARLDDALDKFSRRLGERSWALAT